MLTVTTSPHILQPVGVVLLRGDDGAIVQCRGFANRLPYANEVAAVKRWADEYGLRWAAIER